ncbi:MAG: ABC transporter permease [Proteobacteria bacterium]|nr:ABC transporter permease [Pseudomonadota bacterium]
MAFAFAQFLTGLASASWLFLVAAGLTIVFGVTRVVNFAHGSLYMLGAYIAYSLTGMLSLGGFWLAVPIAAVTVGLLGVVLEMTVLRRLYGAPELFQLLATFGVVLIVKDVALTLFGPVDLFGPRAPGLTGAVRIFGEPIPEYDLFMIGAGITVLAIIWLLFNRTRFGILVRAATEDAGMVAALGVDSGRIFTLSFFIGSTLAGLAGALQVPREPVTLLMDLNVIAEAFVVVVIGGMGSVFGAFIAAILIGQLKAFGILVLPESTLVVAFLAMTVVLALRPNGLFGRAASGPPPAAEIAPPENLGRFGRPAAIALLISLALLPLVAEPFILVLCVDIMTLALFAAGLRLMTGPGGMISFGHAAFFGLGAYAAAATAKAGLGMVAGLAAAPLAAGLGAIVIGWLCVRSSGVYLAMLTLAAAQILWSAAVQWNWLTGGDDGVLGIWPDRWATGPVAYYYLTLAVSGAGMWLLIRLAEAPFGYMLRAGRDAPARARALGIDQRRLKWLAFTAAGIAAGLAGGLAAFAKGNVFPDVLSIPKSVDGLLAILLGGLHAPAGPVIGAAIYAALENILSRLDHWRALLGLSIVGLAVFAPGGVGGWISKRLRHRSRP